MVLEALGQGRMRFEKMSESELGAGEDVSVVGQFEGGSVSGEGNVNVDEAGAGAEITVGDVDEDISWAYEYCGPSTSASIRYLAILPLLMRCTSRMAPQS